MADKFLEFLEEKGNAIHAETWDTFRGNGLKPSVSWQCAKDKENLMGEIIRKYKEIHG
jgi:hypothetical protein